MMFFPQFSLTQFGTHCQISVYYRDRQLLGVVSNAYYPLQNSEAFQWFDILLHESDVTLEAAESLKRGKRIWILAKIVMNPVEIQAGDAIQP